MKPITVLTYLNNYNKHQLKRLDKGLKLVKYGFKKDDIHRLRVDIKKLKALYRLLELLLPKQYRAKEQIAPLKKIFKRAGDIREAQINLAGIKQFILPGTIVTHYSFFLKEQEKEARRQLKKNIKHFKEKSLDNTRLSNLYKQLTFHKIEHILYTESGNIQKLSHGRLTVARLHEIRKRLKSLAEIIKLVQCVRPDFLPNTLPVMLKQTETLIGQWHDRIMLIQSLTNYMLRHKPSVADRTAIRKVILAIRTQNENQLKFLKHKLSKTLTLCLITT